jgi:formate dehydrogenase
MANILCVLYDDPASGYPPEHARDEIPKIEGYHDGQTTPTPEEIDFTPGELLGSVWASLAYGAFSRSAGTN